MAPAGMEIVDNTAWSLSDDREARQPDQGFSNTMIVLQLTDSDQLADLQL